MEKSDIKSYIQTQKKLFEKMTEAQKENDADKILETEKAYNEHLDTSLIDTKEACEIIGCHRNTIVNYTRQGLLKVAKMEGRKALFIKDDIIKIIEYYEVRKPFLRSSIDDKIAKERLSNSVIPEAKELDEADFIMKTSTVDSQLNRAGSEVMEGAINLLVELGIFKEHDTLLAFDLGLEYQLAREALARSYATDGIIEDARGNIKISPYQIMADKHFSRYHAILDRLGISPKERSKLKIEEKKEIDEMGDLF